MNTYRMQIAFARKREADLLRSEKNSEINRYYDKWSTITTKHESWTKPTYYEKAEECMKKSNMEKSKIQQLIDKRKKLKELFDNEKFQYDMELKKLQKASKIKQLSMNNLQKVNEHLKNVQDDRRRLELETKLYGKLRYGMVDEGLFESAKNDHQVLAKLNWLDKEIENQLKKEEEEKEFEKRKLLLEEEARKYEEHLMERQKIRESEIKELRKLQEFHIKALKEREKENESLQKNENDLKETFKNISFELDEYLKRKKEIINNSLLMNINNVYNMKLIKAMLKQCCEIHRKSLKSDIDLLSRIFSLCCDDSIYNLIQKLQNSYDNEVKKQPEIESMYESEAKQIFLKWQEKWKENDLVYDKQIRFLLDKQKKLIEDKIIANVNSQKNLLKVREKHLNAIENANQNLKILIEEEEYYNKQQQQQQQQQKEKRKQQQYQRTKSNHYAERYHEEMQDKGQGTIRDVIKNQQKYDEDKFQNSTENIANFDKEVMRMKPKSETKLKFENTLRKDDDNDTTSFPINSEFLPPLQSSFSPISEQYKNTVENNNSSCSNSSNTEFGDTNTEDNGGKNSRGFSELYPKFGRKKVAWT